MNDYAHTADSDPLRLERGEPNATLAHRMGEGLGVRALGELSKCSTIRIPQPDLKAGREGGQPIGIRIRTVASLKARFISSVLKTTCPEVAYGR